MKTRLGILAAIVGGSLAMLSSLLPWMTTTTSTWTLTIGGLGRGGVVALPMGALMAIAGISFAFGIARKWAAAVVSMCSLVVIAAGVLDLLVLSSASTADASVAVEFGVYAAILGGFTGFVGAWAMRVRPQDAATQEFGTRPIAAD